jgi:O-antigen/teichoic acid export membrane protein
VTDIGEEAPATATVGEDHMANVARGGAFTAVGSLLNMVLSFAIIILVTRRYGPAGAGVFFTVVALFTVAGTTAKLGAETGLVFSISRFRAHGRDEDIVPTIRLALLPALVFALLLGAAAAAWSSVLAGWLSDAASAEDFALVIRNVALLLPAFVAVQVLSGATRGLGLMRPTAYGINVGRPTLQLVPMAAVTAAGLGLGALGLAWAIPLGFTAIGMYWWLNRLLDERDIPRIVLSPRPGLSREFWSYAAPRGFANTLSTAQARVGVLVVSAATTASTAGVFVTVARLVGAVQLFIHAVGQALNPQLSALIAKDDRLGAKRLLQQVSAWTALPVLPVCIALMVFPEAALAVFGPGFERGGPALSILAGTTLVTAILGHTDNVLLMGGRSRTSLLDVGAALVVTLVGLLLLVPAHGLVGAAVGWSLGMIVYSLLPLWQGWRLLGLHPFGPETANLGLAVLPCLGLALAGRWVLGPSITAALLGGSAALIGYLGVVYRRRWELALPELASVFRERRGAA